MNYILRTQTGKQHLTELPTQLHIYGFVHVEYRLLLEGLDLEFPVRMAPVPKDTAYFVDSDKAILRYYEGISKRRTYYKLFRPLYQSAFYQFYWVCLKGSIFKIGKFLIMRCIYGLIA